MHGSFLYVFLASFASAVSGYAMTITLRKKTTVGGYLSIYFFFSFLAAAYLNHLFSLNQAVSVPISSLGIITGLFMIALMFGIGRSLQLGPSALSFAFLNSGSILPPILMALIFGIAFGFSLTLINLFGMAITVVGLFWSARDNLKESLSLRWFLYVSFIFLLQGFLLAVFQWRCLLITEGLSPHLLIPFHCAPEEDLWFMPALFFSATLFQFLYFFFSEKRMPNGLEWVGGVIGGITNGLATFFLLRATWVATIGEKAMLFPTFAVFTILFCNLAGRFIYREKINWIASTILIMGILIGTLF